MPFICVSICVICGKHFRVFDFFVLFVWFVVKVYFLVAAMPKSLVFFFWLRLRSATGFMVDNVFPMFPAFHFSLPQPRDPQAGQNFQFPQSGLYYLIQR